MPAPPPGMVGTIQSVEDANEPNWREAEYPSCQAWSWGLLFCFLLLVLRL